MSQELVLYLKDSLPLGPFPVNLLVSKEKISLIIFTRKIYSSDIGFIPVGEERGVNLDLGHGTVLQGGGTSHDSSGLGGS